MNEMEKEKLDKLAFNINNARVRLDQAYLYRIQNKDLEFQRSYLECVTWIANAIEWFEKNEKATLYIDISKKQETDDYLYLLGVKQIFNSFKHNMRLTQLDTKKYEDFVSLGTKIQKMVWVNSKHLLKRYQNQYTSYQQNFENQSIFKTLEKSISKLKDLQDTLSIT